MSEKTIAGESVPSNVLLECPFCGSPAEVAHFTFLLPHGEIPARAGCAVHCTNKDCMASTPAEWHGENKAISAWNSRHSNTAVSGDGPQRDGVHLDGLVGGTIGDKP